MEIRSLVAKEMAQCLRTLAALAKDLGPIPRVICNPVPGYQKGIYVIHLHKVFTCTK